MDAKTSSSYCNPLFNMSLSRTEQYSFQTDGEYLEERRLHNLQAAATSGFVFLVFLVLKPINPRKPGKANSLWVEASEDHQDLNEENLAARMVLLDMKTSELSVLLSVYSEVQYSIP